MANFEIKTMQRHEVEFAINLAASEGWNPGLHDAASFYRCDPNGFFVGLLDDQPIGCISAVSYGGVFGFIGLYIVLPEYRGRDYGMQLWRHAMHYLQGHNIGLDGVVEQQPNYLKSGFKLAYRNIRYEGIATPSDKPHEALSDLRNINFTDLCAYDRQFFPVNREDFLRAWVAMPDAAGLVYQQQGQIQGYGVIRQCRHGHKIGPLFADSSQIAEDLFPGLMAKVSPGATIFLDVPEPNPTALALVKRHQMSKVFETARMYTQQAPTINLNGLYGVTTFELG